MTINPTALTWALVLLGQSLPRDRELTNADVEFTVRNALKIGAALMALSPHAAGVSEEIQ